MFLGSREDNPFSFRHFLRRTQTPASAANTQAPELPNRLLAEEFEANHFGGARPKTKSRNPRQSFDSDLKSPCGLPDFVQDHLVMEHSLTSNSHPNGFNISDRGIGDEQSVADNPLDLPRNNSPIHAEGITFLAIHLFSDVFLNFDVCSI